MELATPRTFVQIKEVVSEETKCYDLLTAPNPADLDLVRGPGIINNDIKLGWCNKLGPMVSGVLGKSIAKYPFDCSFNLPIFMFSCFH